MAMSKADKIKQKIKEKEALVREYERAAADYLNEGKEDQANVYATKIGKLLTEIEELQDDLFEANINEGENNN